MPTDHDLLLALLILIVGLLYSAVGHAGASGYLAVMALLSVAPDVMKPTALVLNILVAAIGTVQWVRAGHFKWSLFWPFAATSIPAAYLGGTIQLSPQYYRGAVGVILILSAVRLFLASSRPTGPQPHPPSTPVALTSGGVLGFVAGLTGTGGGIFLSPLMLLCNWADAKQTSATAVVFILVNSISGIAGYWSKERSLPHTVPIWAVAAVIGGLIGSYLGSRRLANPTIRRLLAVVLVIAGVKLLFGG